MRRLVVVIVLGLLSLAAPVVGASPAAAADTGSLESDFVARINSLRASKGLGRLAVDGELTAIGRRWAGKMADAGKISHNGNFPSEVQADWVKLGENVGAGRDVAGLMDAFIRSPKHYANLVDGDYTRIGVGVVLGSNGVIFTSHQFERLATDGTNAAAAAPAAPKPKAAVAAPPAKAKAKATPAAAPAAAPAAPPPPPPPPPMSTRLALSIEQLRGRGL